MGTGGHQALWEHSPATLDRGYLTWEIKTLQAAITLLFLWVIKLGVSKHIKNKFGGGGGGNFEGIFIIFVIISKYLIIIMTTTTITTMIITILFFWNSIYALTHFGFLRQIAQCSPFHSFLFSSWSHGTQHDVGCWQYPISGKLLHLQCVEQKWAWKVLTFIHLYLLFSIIDVSFITRNNN